MMINYNDIPDDDKDDDEDSDDGIWIDPTIPVSGCTKLKELGLI